MTIKDLRPGLRAYLLADAALSALVVTRVFPVKLPQGQLNPSVVYSRISGVGDHHMRGPSGLARPRIQIDCWAVSADLSSQLARLVKNRIDGFRGEMEFGSNSPKDSLTVLGVFFDSERDFYDDGNEMYRVSQDYFIWFREF